MRAAVIREFGTPDIFRIEDVATPRPGPGHVLVKILAAGVNRFDQYIREGSVVPELSFPHILGADAAGEIADIGEGVEGFRIGERVVPMTGYPNDEADADIHPNSAAPSFAVSGLSRPGRRPVPTPSTRKRRRAGSLRTRPACRPNKLRHCRWRR